MNEFIRTAIEKYSKTVAKTAFAYLKNTVDAEDVTQDVFLTLMQKAPNFLRKCLLGLSLYKH
nr:sigma factor [Caldicoprobacter guelmensis]